MADKKAGPKEPTRESEIWGQMKAARAAREFKLREIGETTLKHRKISSQLAEIGKMKDNAISEMEAIEGALSALMSALLKEKELPSDGGFTINWDEETIEVKK